MRYVLSAVALAILATGSSALAQTAPTSATPGMKATPPDVGAPSAPLVAPSNPCSAANPTGTNCDIDRTKAISGTAATPVPDAKDAAPTTAPAATTPAPPPH